VSDSESSDDAGDEADIYEIDPNSSEGAREARAARAARRAGMKFSTIGTGDRFHYFAENTMTSKLVHRPRFLVCGKRGMGQSIHVSPAILHSMEHIPVHCLDLPALFGCASKTAEEACAQVWSHLLILFPSENDQLTSTLEILPRTNCASHAMLFFSDISRSTSCGSIYNISSSCRFTVVDNNGHIKSHISFTCQ
jgi:hypothetical protein